MTDQTQDQAALLQALQAQLAAIRPPTAPAASAWTAPAPTPTAIVGVSVPIKLPTPMGTIRIYLSLPAEAGATPQALMQAIESLAAAGLPLDTWQPSNQGGGSGWGGGGNSGGGWGNRGGGGYRR